MKSGTVERRPDSPAQETPMHTEMKSVTISACESDVSVACERVGLPEAGGR